MKAATDERDWPQVLDRDEKYMDAHLFALEKMVQAAGGPHYEKNAGPSAYTPENHYHSFTTITVPRLFDDLPRVKCTTRRPGTQMETAEAIRHGENRWVRDSNFRDTTEELAYDFCYQWAFACVRQVPNRHMGRTTERALFDEEGKLRIEKEESLWPAVYRIPQRQAIIDSRALTTGVAEYLGHLWYANARGLLAEAQRGGKEKGWDLDALRAVAKSAAPTGGSTERSDPEREGSQLDTDTPELEMATLWIPGMNVDPDKTPDEGYNGGLLTLARCQGSKGGKFSPIRREDYYGPRTGPYVIFGAYRLPNKLLPLSPLVAVEGQIRELNRQARALSRSAERHKRVILFDERDKKTALKLKNAQHDFFVGIPGFESTKYAEAEIGGATDSQYKAVAYHQDRLNRISAMDEAQQGSVEGVGTATENQIAARAIETRQAFLRKQFANGVTQILTKVAWFLYHDDRVVFPLGEDAAEDLNMVEPWFHGGLHDQGSDATFDDLELEIEAFSMQRADDASVRAAAQEGINYLISTGPLRSQMSYVDWDKVDELAGQVYGLPNLPGLIDNEAALQAAPFVEGGFAEQPRLGRDVGTGQQYGMSFRAAPRMGQPSMGAQARALPGGNAGVTQGAKPKGFMLGGASKGAA